MTQFLSFTDMVDGVKDNLRAEFKEKLPFAAIVAMSRTAVKCRDLMKGHMREAFDRPTPYALNAARAVPATKQTMSAAVLLREFGGKGTPAEYFLGPEVDGGARRQKRMERAFAAAGFINPGAYIMPGSAAKKDQYGNEARSEIVQITSVLRAFGEQGYRANRTKGWAKKNRVGQIFVVRQGNAGYRAGLKPGVYRRKAGGAVECLMLFTSKAPRYRVRLPFDDLVQQDAARVFPDELKAAMEQFS